MTIKKYLIVLFLALPVLCFSNTKFVDYYNKPENWDTQKVGQGTLIVRERLELTQEIILPNNIEVKIIENGEIITTHNFALTGDPNNPSASDPRQIHLKKINAVMTIINTLLLD